MSFKSSGFFVLRYNWLKPQTDSESQSFPYVHFPHLLKQNKTNKKIPTKTKKKT